MWAFAPGEPRPSYAWHGSPTPEVHHCCKTSEVSVCIHARGAPEVGRGCSSPQVRRGCISPEGRQGALAANNEDSPAVFVNASRQGTGYLLNCAGASFLHRYTRGSLKPELGEEPPVLARLELLL